MWELPPKRMDFLMGKEAIEVFDIAAYSTWYSLIFESEVSKSREIHPIWETPVTLLFRLALRLQVQQLPQTSPVRSAPCLGSSMCIGFDLGDLQKHLLGWDGGK
jgi:hypothetical protein